MIPDKPYVTTGTVIFHDAASPPEALPAPKRKAPSMPAPGAALRQKILATCGSTVKDVEVRSNPDSGMTVIIKVTRSDAIDEVLSKTSGLREMASPGVHTSFEIDP